MFRSFCIYIMPFNIICRYDHEAKKLKHIKPLSQKLLQSLGGELDFLGPYPFNHVGLVLLSVKLQYLLPRSLLEFFDMPGTSVSFQTTIFHYQTLQLLWPFR